ncbi:CocE/NonD family hydrolase (plasmid) [Streptomyces sp. BHT-5-2]|uniref:CocE/NonD family hydrolase n=1 Tax=Streptomyces sp. BHT-5-2 TaxID=2866715 RepID=UPI001C8DAF73|nr:CocE/NonD family hydrolase [Streptomyces sp. BHT-5-2]QZL08579.1 CocE/NonD family hydrolase [Streptomyces sp. BHT-5-2]
MTPSRTTVRAAIGTVSAAVLATTALTCAPAQAAPAPARTSAATARPAAADSPTLRFVDITGAGGITLKANVFTPAGADGTHRYPLVVLPTSWAMPQVEYLAQARKLAASGYVVIGYNSRGFWQSGGQIETAGPQDVADASKVIDWGLAHTSADPRKIGMAGVSYGAGISLLAAGADKRIKAVAALSGWADLIGSIYSGRTPHLQAAAMLGGAGALTGRPSPELQRVLKEFLSADMSKEKDMIAWGRKRSPATYLDRINANGAAILLGNAWGDSLFPPDQYAAFFEKLKGPKRLEFRPGDHATAEGLGLLGLPNDTWNDTRRWLDHYLRGTDNGIDREPPVLLKSRSTGAYEGYKSWQDVPSAHRRIALDGTRRIRTGTDSGADGGLIFLSSILDQFFRLPPMASIPLLPRSAAAVWESAPYGSGQRVRGTTRLHTTVTPTAADGTAIAYLYDVGPLGLGKLVTHAPVTFHGRAPGKPFTLDLDLFATAYDVPAGHRLAVVVDTVDPLYIAQNPAGARLSFSSPANDPSYVSVPVRD